MKNRVEGYENCPGCVAVDKDGKPCCPYNAAICPIAWAKITRK
jgi:hypothetical protein